jgi:hypothetical protein
MRIVVKCELVGIRTRTASAVSLWFPLFNGAFAGCCAPVLLLLLGSGGGGCIPRPAVTVVVRL